MSRFRKPHFFILFAFIQYICLESVVALIADPCVQDSDCVTPSSQSECSFGGICRCKDEYTPNEDFTDCLGLAKELGEKCEQQYQCQQGEPGPLSDCLRVGESTERTCQCKGEAINVPGEHHCYRMATYVVDPCEVNIQCTAPLGDLSQCINEKCTCIAESVASINRKTCLPVTNEIGGDCLEHSQCTSGLPNRYSACVSVPGENRKVCNCTADGIREPEKHYCHKIATTVGDDCTANLACTTGLGDLSECAKIADDSEITQCRCKPRIGVPSQDGKRCLEILNELGEPCTETDQCTSGASGGLSDCLPSYEDPDQKVCNCTDDAITDVNGNVCKRKADKVRDECEFNRQCTAKLGELVSCKLDDDEEDPKKRCLCDNGAVESSRNDRCLPGNVLIGRICEDKNQCVGKPGITSDCKGVCDCMADYVSSNDRDDCLEKATAVGAKCTQHQQCQLGKPGSHSRCKIEDGDTEGICVCPETTVQSTTTGKCLLKAEHVGDPCEEPIQCQPNLENSLCLINKCVCNDGFVESTDKKKCLRPSELNGPCEDNSQCPQLSECVIDPNTNLTICQCSEGYIQPPDENIKICNKLAEKVGETCDGHPNQCSTIGGEGATCNAETLICECDKILHVPSSDSTECLKKADRLYGPCKEDVQCSPIDGSECAPFDEGVSTRCQCKPEYVESDLKGSCKKIVNEYDGECTDNSQCKAGVGENTECKSGRCVCLPRYIYHNSECYYPVPLGETCNHVEECIVGVSSFATCSDEKKCECIPGAKEYKRNCYEAKHVGDTCSRDNECRASLGSSSSCNEGICGCNDSTHVESSDRSECLEIADRLNSPCKEIIQCKLLPNTVCVMDTETSGACKCTPGEYVESDSQRTCKEIVSEYEGACTDNSQCLAGLGENTRCANEKCQCMPNYLYYKNKCYYRSYLGGVCNSQEECIVGVGVLATCSGGKCTCARGSTEYIDNCYEKKMLGDNCTTSVECEATMGATVSCAAGICACRQGFEPYMDNLVCVSGAVPSAQGWGYTIILLICGYFSLVGSIL